MAWFYFVSPGKVVINSNGDVQGIQAIRAVIQGNKFWRNQHETARREFQFLNDQPREEAKWEAEMRQMDAKFAREDAEMCAKEPSICSTPKSEADKLRDQADAIEASELKQELEIYRQKRMGELRQIIIFASSRMK